MPNLPPLRSPFFVNPTASPRDDCAFGIDVVATLLRTSARVSLPSAHALWTAFIATSAATPDGAPKYSPSQPWAFVKLATAFDFGSTGKNESYEPAILNVDGSNRPSEPKSFALLPDAFSWFPNA